MKEDYKVLRQEISASCFEIGTIGLTNGEKKPTTVLQRQDDVALLLSESIKKAEDRVADIKQRYMYSAYLFNLFSYILIKTRFASVINIYVFAFTGGKFESSLY